MRNFAGKKVSLEYGYIQWEKNLRRRARVDPSENLNTVWPLSMILS